MSKRNPTHSLAATAPPKQIGHAVASQEHPLHGVAWQNYVFALQSAYAEIFFLDTSSNTVSSLYHSVGHGDVPAPACDFEDFFNERGHTQVHPAWQQLFLSTCTADNLRQVIEHNETIEFEYRERRNENEDYCWISAAVRPIPSGNGALLLLRDVTRTRESESSFFTALQNNYGDIFVVNTFTGVVRLICNATNMPVNSNVSFEENTRRMLATRVHPDDRQAFSAFYNAEALQTAIRENRRVSQEYRVIGVEGDYCWIESLVLPMPGNTDELLVLCQDIGRRKYMETVRTQIEQRYAAVFRQSCDIMVEVDLNADVYTQTCFAELNIALPAQDSYTAFYEALVQTVHPDDQQLVRQRRGLEWLRKAFAEGYSDQPCQYRIQRDDVCNWFESRIFFIRDRDRPMVVTLARDITVQKNLEAVRDEENQRIALALRDTYSEIYEIDIIDEVGHLLFNAHSELASPESEGNFSYAQHVDTVVHPVDTNHMQHFFSGENLRACFEQGLSEVSEEYRALGRDDKYHWVSAIVMPIKEGVQPVRRAMLFIKDISLRKEQEEQQRVIEQYSLALRSTYDIFLEYNVTRNKYRIIHYSTNKYVFPSARGSLSCLITVDSRRLIHPDDRERFQKFFATASIRADFATGRKHRMAEFRTLQVSGDFHWTSYIMFPLVTEEGADETYLVFGLNVHAYKAAEEIAHRNTLLEQQRAADERYRIIVEQTNTLIFEWKREDASRYISPELVTRFAGNYDQRTVLEVWREDTVIHPADIPIFMAFVKAEHIEFRREMTVRLLQRSGSYLWCRVSVTMLRDDRGEVRRMLGTVNDVDEAVRAAQALREKAERDSLTGIYNLRTFYALATQLMHEHPERQYSIISLDIDEFKVINDLYGMEEGDWLLKKIAATLQSRMSDHCVCGRVSADSFCACVDYDTDGILTLVHHVTAMLDKYPLPSKVLPSFGICRVDNVDTPINVLCDWANMALKRVKGNAVTFHAFYDETLRESMLRERRIESRMHNALDLGQFKLYLQPKIHIPTARIIGAEGLVRWEHPESGIIPPDDFIPLFEKNGFIIQLDQAMWDQTCALLRRWLDEGRTPVPISVNMSRMHVHDTRLCEKFAALLRKYRLPTKLLELELTENIFLDNKSQSLKTITALRDMGFHFLLDDFGAGYSSLNILKSLPVETLKIDRGFLDEVVATERGKTIIRCVITLAKSIDMEVIAEGVETAEQAAFLCQTGCVFAQGFHYAPALPVAEFEELYFSTGVATPRVVSAPAGFTSF